MTSLRTRRIGRLKGKPNCSSKVTADNLGNERLRKGGNESKHYELIKLEPCFIGWSWGIIIIKKRFQRWKRTVNKLVEFLGT